jgi:hypothetical protein
MKALTSAAALVGLRERTSELLKLQAYFLANLGRYTEALLVIEGSLKLGDFKDDFEQAKARFNRACYKAVLKHSEEEIHADLEAAIAVDKVFIKLCEKVPDLKSINIAGFLSRIN